MRPRPTPRALAALVAALAVAAPSAATAHPFVPRASLAVPSGPEEPAPSASQPGPWTPSPAASTSSPAPSAGASDPGAAPPAAASDGPVNPFARAAAPPAAPAPPDSPPLPPHPLRLSAAIDVPVIALSVAIWTGTDLAGRDLRWSGCGMCDTSGINGLDRRVLGNDSPTAARASDVLVYSAIGLPLVADLADALAGGRRAPGGYRHAAGGWARDAVVLFEVLAVNLAVTNLVKFAVRRPRPYSYDADTTLDDIEDNDARLSFFSGHASTAFSMMTAYATIFTYRHPRPRAAVPVWLGAIGLATATAVLRVVAGKHFWTDIAAGALAGSAVGVLVPTLHRNPAARRLSPGLTHTRGGGAMLTLSGAF